MPKVMKRSPYEVACPRCGAPTLAPCRFPSGTPVLPHKERMRRAIGNSLIDFGVDRARLWAQMKNLAKQDV